MSQPYQDRPTSTLPEVHHQESESYAYALTQDDTPGYPVASTKGYYSPPTDNVHPAKARKGWMRWWILALLGLLIATIAGLVGGFIGQEIQKSQEASSTAPSCPDLTSNSSSATPPPGSPSNVIAALTLPDTGCSFPSSKVQRRIDNTSKYWKVKYTTVCNTGWTPAPKDVILGLYTISPSDCIEACAKFNQNTVAASNKDRCVGGGYIVPWTNQTLAAKEQNGQTFNCYLMKTNGSMRVNDRAEFGTEVVSLCLEGQCDEVGET